MELKEQILEKINQKTKPLGALGMLEAIALKVALLQNTASPVLTKPHILVFAADHGIAREGVSAYPQEVTYQMVQNFLSGGAAINVFARQHDIQLKIIDAGVNFDFPPHPDLFNASTAKGTHSFLHRAAMTDEQLQWCFSKGRELVEELAAGGCNVIGFGEMGIGNTSSASLITSSLCRLELEDCIGRGTGLNDAQLQTKVELLTRARDFHGEMSDPLQVLATFGGFEIAQMCGAMMAAREKGMLILVDGFITSSAFLVAHAMQPALLDNALFCHLSKEYGHRRILEYLDQEAILHLQMRLGEGTGCAVALPIIRSALAFLNEMASFESAAISNKP